MDVLYKGQCDHGGYGEVSELLLLCMVGTPAGRTPGLMSSTAVSDTPLNLHNVDAAAIRRAAADLPTSVLNTLQQVAGQHTPYQPFQVNSQSCTFSFVSPPLPLL